MKVVYNITPVLYNMIYITRPGGYIASYMPCYQVIPVVRVHRRHMLRETISDHTRAQQLPQQVLAS